MIKDSAKELFEIVLVWKLDRFSRDRYDSAHYKHILKKNGVKVISGTVKYFSRKRLCKNEVLRREVRRGGCQAPLICPVAYSGGGVKGAASAAFIGVTGYGHADP